MLMDEGKPLVAYAPAKVTLSLRVIGTRSDGFHELEALTVSVEQPADTVTVTPTTSDRSSIEITGPTAIGVPADETNLVLKAWEALRVPFGLPHAHFHIHKHIPAAGGLGGGSADAAAALRIASRIGDIPEAVLMETAERLGSDIPFCVKSTPAWMRGKGEVLTPVEFPEPQPMFLVTVPIPSETPAVFACWDALPAAQQHGVPVQPPSWLEPLLPVLQNDLTQAALQCSPELGIWMERLQKRTKCPVLLLGSGSSMAIFPEAEQQSDIAQSLEELAAEYSQLAWYAARPLACPPLWDH